MKRVMIVGGPGSGKSTLATLLGEQTSLPVFHMDHIHWNPGWDERDVEEKNAMCHEIHILDEWIFEGNHSRTFQERILRADTYIWLDVPLWIRLFRVIRRTITDYGKTRPDMQENCPERFSGRTLSFIAFIWRTRHTARAKYREIADNSPDHLSVHCLQNLYDVRHFLKALS